MNNGSKINSNEMPIRSQSNTFGFIVGVILTIATVCLGMQLDDGSQLTSWRAALIGIGLLPLSITCAELRSGYTWKNLAHGNRGVSRVEQPHRYWLSIIIHLAMAGGFIAYGLLGTPPR